MTQNATASGAGYTVTALFDSDAAVEKARSDLLKAGFSAADISLQKGVEAAASAPPNEGVLQALFDTFISAPTHERRAYEEALRRGGTLVAVRTGPERHDLAIDILDRNGAMDLDELASPSAPAAPRPGGPGSLEQAPLEGANQHDALVNPSANFDVRERIGVGTSDMTVGTDIDPPSAVSGPDSGAGASQTAGTAARSRARAWLHNT